MLWIVIINSFVCTSLIALYWYMVKTYTGRLIRLEKRFIDLSLRYKELISTVSVHGQKIRNPKKLSYMEGTLDLVHENKVANVKAVFHPRKTLSK